MEITFAGQKMDVGYVLLNQETSTPLAYQPVKG